MTEISEMLTAIVDFGISTVLSAVAIVMFIKQQNKNSQFLDDIRKSLQDVAKCITDRNMMSTENFYDVVTDKIWISTTICEKELLKIVHENNIEKYFEQITKRVEFFINETITTTKEEIERLHYHEGLKKQLLDLYKVKVIAYKVCVKSEFENFLDTKDYDVLKLNIQGIRSFVYNELKSETNMMLKGVE